MTGKVLDLPWLETHLKVAPVRKWPGILSQHLSSGEEEGGSGAGIFENRSRGSFWANDRCYVVPGYVFRVILALLGPGGAAPGDF